MSARSSQRIPLSPNILLKEHVYTKVQVHYASDVQDIVLKTENEPTCRDLANVLEETFRISSENQLVYYRGQRLHHKRSKSLDRSLSSYGIFSGSAITLVGKRGFL